MNNGLFLVLLIVLAIPTFLQMRRQKARITALKELQASLVVGDYVITTSGIHAVVANVGESVLDLEIAPGVITRWERSAIMQKVAQPENSDSAPVMAEPNAEQPVEAEPTAQPTAPTTPTTPTTKDDNDETTQHQS